jgi:SAM-dependent methyltransferase
MPPVSRARHRYRFLRQHLMPLVPSQIRRMRGNHRARAFERRMEGRPHQDIFSAIYMGNRWGFSPDVQDRYCSGVGSHEPWIVQPYVAGLADWVNTLSGAPSVVDIGCGDFAVGQRVRHLFSTYVAVDIVGEVIQANRARFVDLDVDFRVIDVLNEPLPHADVGLIRQVFQHLSNASIGTVLRKVRTAYSRIIVTEEAPAPEAAGVPNVDIPSGLRTRSWINGSHVDLTRPPFELDARDSQVICEVPIPGGRIVTTVYTL